MHTKALQKLILALPLEPGAAAVGLLRLATIRPSTALLLVARHARAECDVDTRWHGEGEGLCHFCQVELVDIEHGP